MKIIFDLDRTLFDKTSFFNEKLFRILKENGATKKEIIRSYKEIAKIYGNFIFEEQARLLKKRSPKFDTKSAIDKFLSLEKKDFAKYIDKEVYGTLQTLQKIKIELVLLSKGAEEFQMRKIRLTGLEDFFDKIVICQNDKISAMKKIDPREGDFFVNDYWEETKAIKEQFPLLKYFLFRKYDAKKLRRNAKIDIPSVYSVKEILKALPEKN